MTTFFLFSVATLAFTLSCPMAFAFELKPTMLLRNKGILIGSHHRRYIRPEGNDDNDDQSAEANTIGTSLSTSTSTTHEVYLRFSPLIGGPKFLPIHVEVMFRDCKQKDEDDDGLALEILHRFDFVPAHPNDSETIMRLLSLQSVPGLVRHRILVGEGWNDKNVSDGKSNISLLGDNDGGGAAGCATGLNYSIVPSERITALIGKGNNNPRHTGIRGYDQDEMSTFHFAFQLDMEVNDIAFNLKEGIVPLRVPKDIETLIEEKSGMELHLLFNNCYTFAFDVLKSLKMI